MKKTNLLYSAALCAALTMSAACSDDANTNNATTNNTNPDMSNTTDQGNNNNNNNNTGDMGSDMTTDMSTTPDMDMTTGMDMTADMDTTEDMEPDQNNNNNNNNNGGDLTISNFPQKFAEALCAKAQSCCTAMEYEDNFAGAECATTFGDLYADFLPGEAEVTAGKLTFDAAIAQNVINTLNTVACAQIDQSMDVPFPYIGKIAEGQECETDFECAAPAGQEAICVDTCVVIKPRGGACADSIECDNTSYCGPGGTCDAQLPAGAACEDDYDCESTLCGYVEEGKCDPKLADGEECFEDSECQGGYCDQDTVTCTSTPPAGGAFCSGF